VKISGDHVFAFSREEVWAGLTDPRVLAASVPGAKRLEVTGPDAYAVTVKVGVGAVTGTYDGTLELTDQAAPDSCTVRAAVAGTPGSVRTVAQMRLTTREDGTTLLRYDADASLTGPLAGVGQRLLGAAAKRTTAQFLEAVAIAIHAGDPEGGDASDAQERTVFASPAPRAPVTGAFAGADVRLMALSAGAGFALALVGVAVGRLTARR
jgi:carbon monoxide dehydrogenase subunit G